VAELGTRRSDHAITSESWDPEQVGVWMGSACGGVGRPPGPSKHAVSQPGIYYLTLMCEHMTFRTWFALGIGDGACQPYPSRHKNLARTKRTRAIFFAQPVEDARADVQRYEELGKGVRAKKLCADSPVDVADESKAGTHYKFGEPNNQCVHTVHYR